MERRLTRAYGGRLIPLALLVITGCLYWGHRLIPASSYTAVFPWYEAVVFSIAIFLAYMSGAFRGSLETFKPKELLLFLLFLVAGLTLYYFSNRLYFSQLPILEAFPSHANDVANVIGRMPSWLQMPELIVIGPIYEELIFREYLYRFVGKKWLAFVLSAVIFTWMHSGPTISFFCYLPMAVVLCLIYQRRGRVTESMMMHMVFNFVITFLPFFTMSMFS